MLRDRPLRSTVKRLARATGNEVFPRTGYDLVKRHFYSPLPDLAHLPSDLWERPSALLGVDLRLDAALALLEGPLAPFLDEFRPSVQPRAARNRFYIENGTYESVDAETLYATLRYANPARVVELGSGSSSHVIDAARHRNAAEGADFEHRIFDPFPWHASRLGPVEGAQVSPVPAQEVALDEFDALSSGDVLFVDTSHTVKTGGDVPHIILNVLPRLSQGTLVHFHDIFLPYEYPQAWVMDARRAFGEQYMLQAFLAFNRDFEVVFPAHAVARSAPGVVRGLVPSFGPAVAPGAFWIRRTTEPQR
jgi:hypothetical protein